MEIVPYAQSGQLQLTSALIANALDSEAAHTSFGKLPLAVEKSAPVYSFGSGTRDKFSKVYISPEHTAGITKVSPGPKYEVQDNLNFKTTPNFSIGKDPRVTLGKAQYYDHYNIADTFTNPIAAKNYTHKSAGNIKFGTESRMPPPSVDGPPGPQYYPGLRPEVKKAPQYTLGARRTHGGSALKNQISTPSLVGPGRYVPERSALTSVHRNPSQWSIGLGDKVAKPAKSVTKNQTYAKSTACGPQVLSKKKSAPAFAMNRATRDQVGKLGMFKDMMSTQQPAVRIPMPRFN